MNHLGDTNKMISDTPRMDSVAGHARGIVDAAILAEGMKLERELYAANAEVERLINKVAQLYEGAEEQKQRIKRLEEVGDEMEKLLPEDYICDKAAIRWIKARDAK